MRGHFLGMRLRMFGSLAIFVCLLNVAVAESNEPRQFTDEEKTFFTHDVLPILQAHCFQCHGGEPKVQGGLKLTSREDILKGGESGPAVSFDPTAESLLLGAIRYESFEMPPKGKLPQAQIDVLTRWVSQGMPWSNEAVADTLKGHGVPQVDEKARNFWAFKPVARPEVPAVKDTAWVRTPIDAFILSKLEAHEFRPAPPASKTDLLRRLHYAVTGLPPTLAEVESFLNDTSPDAYEQRVDALLASRHYGEHWGRHWLDLVRYAETNSFERDGPKPNAWKYRDYVIRAFNEDKPYSEFIRQQLAGDELAPVTREGVIATGFYRLGLWDDEPADKEQAYYDELDDIVSTTGQAFLGLTIGCARCHDHKIDPFPQKDYYRFLAFFHGVNTLGSYDQRAVVLRIIDSSADDRGHDAPDSFVNIKPYQEDLAKLEGEARKFAKKLAELNRQIDAIHQQAAAKLVAGEKDDFAYEQNCLAILEKNVGKVISAEELERYRALRKERDLANQNRPAALETVLAVVEQGAKPRETYLLARGNPAGREEKLEPGFPSVVSPPDVSDPSFPAMPDEALTSGRRKVVADWIADAANPLTARVLVNRLWQYNFGRGIVRSSSNFGYQGTPPTHPELLDWLANEFIKSGMRIKPMQRLLLTSNAFRMATDADEKANEKDPENDLYSHFDLRRLTAEEIRDSILAASGNLNLEKSAGPSIYPIIPKEVLAGQSRPGDGWGKSTPQDRASRSVFVYIKRSLALPMLTSFDAPDPDSPCPVRFSTTQPSQALGMINSPFLNEQSRLFAENITKEASDDTREQVRLALRRVMQRTPSEADVERGLQFLESMQREHGLSAKVAFERFCLLAFNLNEFVFLN